LNLSDEDLMSEKKIRVGLLGCGAVAQIAHIPAALRAKRVQLVALCDGANDLLEKMGRKAGVQRLYTEFSAMLADEQVQAVIIAAPDVFHVSLATEALAAGKHVLVEKPLGTGSAECLDLLRVVDQTGLKLQVGSMKRHDPGVAFAHRFLQEQAGPILSVSGVYRDTIFRPDMQETCLDPILSSEAAIKPKLSPKADLEHYNLTTQGAHLFDNIYFLAGRIAAVTAQVAHRDGHWSWHGLLEFEHGGRGHFELTCKACADWCERYEVFGQSGSVQVEVSLPFYHRPAQVRAFDGRSQVWSQPLGGQSNAYKNQLESFAEAILHDKPTSPNVGEGLETVRVLEAVEASISTGQRIELPKNEGA